MTGSQLCVRCGGREVWAAVVSVPALRENNGVLTRGPAPERLCKECYHTEQRALAAEQRRQRGERLARLGSSDLSEIAQHLALAVRYASDEEWREIVTSLREDEELRGSPWPPEIRRYLRKDARDHREGSA